MPRLYAIRPNPRNSSSFVSTAAQFLMDPCAWHKAKRWSSFVSDMHELSCVSLNHTSAETAPRILLLPSPTSETETNNAAA
nr:hypothetical protein CFP56_70141 [Quercus suber]